MMNIPDNFKPLDVEKTKKDVFDKWILNELYKTVKEVNKNLENAKFNDVAHSLQSFFWGSFCDWYIELVKSKINSTDEAVKSNALSILIYVLKEFLKLLHPVMPFITEEIYQKLPEVNKSIMVEDFPDAANKKTDKKNEILINKFFGLIYLIRNIRGEKNIPPEKKVEIFVKSDDKDLIDFCRNNEKEILTLSKGLSLIYGGNITKPSDAAVGANENCEVFINLEGLIDKTKEIEKLTKEYEKIKIDFDKTDGKLNNENFVSKAPKEVIEKEKAKLEEFRSKMEKLEKNIAYLKK